MSYHADWSPDGSKIVTSVDYAINIIDRHSLEKVQLTNGKMGSDGCPAWSPDGLNIAFSRYNKTCKCEEIFMVDTEGIREKQITFHENMRCNTSTCKPQWSPNGKYIAYVYTSNPYASCGVSIYIMDLETRRFKSVLSKNICSEFSWSPDSSMLIFCADPDKDDEYDVFTANPDGSVSNMLLDIDPGLFCFDIEWRPKINP